MENELSQTSATEVIDSNEENDSISNRKLLLQLRSEMHSGPLPHPDTLSRYNEIIPNGADRIMSMAERQQNHRIEIEKEHLRSNSRQSSRGQFFGFTIAIICILASVFLIYNDKYIGGSVLGGTTLLSLVYMFLFGKKQQTENKEEEEDQNVD